MKLLFAFSSKQSCVLPKRMIEFTILRVPALVVDGPVHHEVVRDARPVPLPCHRVPPLNVVISFQKASLVVLIWQLPFDPTICVHSYAIAIDLWLPSTCLPILWHVDCDFQSFLFSVKTFSSKWVD
uniref:Uncharacterized protein n=1 Tax=Entomoneis paludosa TaxID=265537 RepID=A0A7S2Y7C9_9STRA